MTYPNYPPSNDGDSYTAAASFHKAVMLRESARRRNANMQSQITKYEIAYRLNYVSSKLMDDEILVAGLTMPVGTPVHIPSTGPALVDRFVEQIRTDKPQVEAGVILKGKNTGERRRALEALGSAAMERIAESEDRNIWIDTTFSLALRGSACLTVAFDADLWPEDTDEQAHALAAYLASLE